MPHRLVLWIDMNLPPALADWIVAHGHGEARHLATLGLDVASDREVFDAARKNGAVLVSKDADFARLVTQLGPPPSVIWVRTGNLSTGQLIERIGQQFAAAITLIDQGEPLIELSAGR